MGVLKSQPTSQILRLVPRMVRPVEFTVGITSDFRPTEFASPLENSKYYYKACHSSLINSAAIKLR